MATRRLLTVANDLLNLLSNGFQGNAERLQRFRRHPFALMDETEQDVFGADVVMVQHPCFFLRQNADASRAVGEPFKHVLCSSLTRGPMPRVAQGGAALLTLVARTATDP